MNFGRKVIGVFWSVVKAEAVAKTWSDVARAAVHVDRVGAVAVGRDGDGSVIAIQGRLVAGVDRGTADREVPVPGPRLIVPPVALIETDPAKLGDEVAPLPLSVADEVVIVYVPAGRGCPLSVRLSVASVIETLPVTVAE